MRYLFFEEKLTENLFKQMWKLLKEHDEEAGEGYTFLNPQFDNYFQCAEKGVLKIFTVRDGLEDLRGYAAFWINHDIKYKHVKCAVQELLFLDRRSRGANALKFIKWCDSTLKSQGVERTYHYVTTKNNFSKLLERTGYTKRSELWVRGL